MFLTYLRRELRRRRKQAMVVAFGLALGIGLVVTVSAASAGVKTAQTTVLHSLYGVGTDVSVTETPAAGTGGPGRFGFGGGTGTRPKAGTTFSRDSLSPAPGQATFASSTVASIAKLTGVNAATGGLELNDTSISGTFGSFGFGVGGSASSGSSSPPPISFSSFTVTGVQPSSTGVGLLTASEITSGRYFTSSDSTAAVAIVASSYATQHSLKVGSTVKVAGKEVTVVGVAETPSGSTTDVFLPIGEAQKLASASGKISTVYVSVASASDVAAVQTEIQHLVPKATVTTSADLAKEVSGSLASAASLATNLGRWLAIAALLAAFLIAALLMMGAVSRRVREFGTLKALGWRTRRVVGQVMGEGLTLGIVGGVVGIGLGFAASAVVAGLAPTLSATVGQSSATGGGFGGGSAFTGGGGFGGGTGFTGGSRPAGFGRGTAALSHTVLVHLSAPVQVGSLGLAIGLAVAGGIIAGSFGAWQAARLGPAAALRKVA
jgi:putative ABC transport system permease protein